MEFAEAGELRVLETGAYDSRTVEWKRAGGWAREPGKDAVRFWLAHSGLICLIAIVL